MIGSLLIAWTIRLSLLLYAAVLVIEWWPRASIPWRTADRGQRTARWLWTIACGLFVTHVICALHFYHHWSHTHVLAHTAEETQKLIGWAFGEGVYFSYGFLLLWVADVVWWWMRPAGYRSRPTLIHAAVHGYLFFIAFHGAIVFESGPTRWLGIPLCLALLVLIIWKAVAWRPSISLLPAADPADPAETA